MIFTNPSVHRMKMFVCDNIFSVCCVRTSSLSINLWRPLYDLHLLFTPSPAPHLTHYLLPEAPQPQQHKGLKPAHGVKGHGGGDTSDLLSHHLSPLPILCEFGGNTEASGRIVAVMVKCHHPFPSVL